MADSPAAAWRDLVAKATKGPWIVHSEYHSGPKWMHLPASLIYTVGFAIDAMHRGVGPGIDDYVANARLIIALRGVSEALAEWVASKESESLFTAMGTAEPALYPACVRAVLEKRAKPDPPPNFPSVSYGSAGRQGSCDFPGGA